MSYDKIEALYERIKDTKHLLLPLVERFHNYHEEYLNGEHDVIYGLQYMDELDKEISIKINEEE